MGVITPRYSGVMTPVEQAFDPYADYKRSCRQLGKRPLSRKRFEERYVEMFGTTPKCLAPNLGDLAERIAAATEDYGAVREQGRQDGIIDGRKGYAPVGTEDRGGDAQAAPPVPPLPTEDDTMIRPTWRPGRDPRRPTKMVLHKGAWHGVSSFRCGADELWESITGFEVLAKPISQDRGDEEDSIMRRLREAMAYVQGVRDALDLIADGLRKHGNVDPEDIYQARMKFYGGRS